MSPEIFVLDASALLCVLFGEAGAETVEPLLPLARISAVNFSEVVAKLADRGAMAEEILTNLEDLEVEVVDLDRRQAMDAGLLRAATRRLGLSFGDRACLALAAGLNATAVTADRAWAKLDLGISIRLVR